MRFEVGIYSYSGTQLRRTLLSGFREAQTMGISLSDTSLLRTGAYINGQWTASDTGETLAVTNPANGKVIARVASCGTIETRRAIEAAQIGGTGLSRTGQQYCVAGST